LKPTDNPPGGFNLIKYATPAFESLLPFKKLLPALTDFSDVFFRLSPSVATIPNCG
jgi:hypothetical protein